MMSNEQLHSLPNIRERNKKFGPVIDRCFIVRWLRLHVFINLIRSIWRPIGMKDWFNLSEDFYPEVQYARYKRVRQKHPNWSFGLIIFLRLMIVPLAVGSLLGAATAALGYTGPLFIKQILKFVNDPTPESHEQRRAYKYAGLWMSMYFLRMLFNEQAQWVCHSVAMKAEMILNLAVYDKMMRMSSAYRRYLEEGDFITFFQIDSKILFNFVKSFYVLSSAPTTLIMAQIFVCIEVGAYGLCLILVILFSLVLQLLIDRHVAKLTLRKLKYYSERLTCNLEMFSSLKQLKSLGWEELVTLKNTQYRKIENRYNLKCYLYNSFYSFIVNFAPPLSVLLIFAIDIAISGQQKYSATHIYTVITYIGLIQSPLNSLPSTIILGIEAIACCRRVEHLLRAEEVKSVETYALERGTVVIRHLYGTWDSAASKKHHLSKNAEFAKKYKKVGREERPTTYHTQGMPSARAFEVTDTSLMLNIPFDIDLQKGQRLIVIGEVGSTKEGLIDAFLGHLSVREGEIRYGGKIGYLPQSPFLRHDTIRNNILFGEPLDEQRLVRVEKMVGIYEELGHLEKKDNAVLEEISTLMGLSDRQRVVLARNLYYDPDIFLFDNFFDEVDTESYKSILDLFNNVITDKTLIISTKNRNFMRPQDKILIFEETKAVEYGYMRDLVKNPNSYVHYWRQRRINIIQEIQPLGLYQRKESYRTGAHMLRKNLASKGASYRQQASEATNGNIAGGSTDEKQVTALTLPTSNLLTAPTLDGMNGNYAASSTAATPVPSSTSLLAPPAEKPKAAPPAPDKPKRFDGVAMKFYWKFIKSGSLIVYLLMVGLLALGQGMNVFSVWWIGHAKVQFKTLSSAAIIGIYIGIVLGYGVTLLIIGLLVSIQSVLNTENLAKQITGRFERVSLGWAQKQNNAFLVGFMFGRDNDEMFAINNYFVSIIQNIFFFIGTIILSGYENSMVFVLGFVVMFANFLVVLIYIRAEREELIVGIGLLKKYDILLEDLIFGLDCIRSQNKVDKNRESLMDALYDYHAVYKANYRWLAHGLSIFSDLTGLGVTFGTMMIIINRKMHHKERFNVTGAAISLSNKLNTIFMGISNGLANIEIQMRGSVKFPLMYAMTGLESDYAEPKPPANWPIDNSINVQRVTFKHDQFKEPSLKDVSFSCKPGEKVMMFEDVAGTAIESLFMLINKLRQPTQNSDNSRGYVLVGGYAHEQVAAKYLRKKVMLLDSYPFMMSASLRENIDPFRQHSDEEVKSALEKVGLWEEIPATDVQEQSPNSTETESRLAFRVKDAGGNISLGHQQLINICRAILAKPCILMRDYMATGVSIKQRNLVRKLTFEDFKDTTMLFSTLDTISAMRCDRVLYFENGSIKEDSSPRRLLENGRSEFSVKLREIDPVLYRHIVSGTISSEQY